MLPRPEWQQFLAGHEPFRDLPAGLLGLIVERATERHFAAGQRILRRGDKGESLMVILEGRVRVSVPNRAGGHLLAVVEAGGVVGEMALLTQRPRNADVTALEATTMLSLSAQAFEELLGKNHELAVVLTSLLAERLGHDRLDGLGETELEGYRIGDCLGRGGMAIVYRAIETVSGREVALKMMSHSLVYDRNALRRFQREADVAERFDHPHVARVLGRFEAYKTFFLVMELCDGPTLQALLRRHGRFAEADARAALGQIALALDHVHGHGVIHRDLKPSNVLLDSAGRLRLTDFGLARPELPSDITQAGTIVGTPAYMAPELLSGAEADERVDIYALGCVAWELLTGAALFRESNLGAIITRKVAFDPPAADAIRRGLSDDLYDLLQRTLARDPDARTFRPAEIAHWAAPLSAALLEQGRSASTDLPDPESPTRTHSG